MPRRSEEKSEEEGVALDPLSNEILKIALNRAQRKYKESPAKARKTDMEIVGSTARLCLLLLGRKFGQMLFIIHTVLLRVSDIRNELTPLGRANLLRSAANYMSSGTVDADMERELKLMEEQGEKEEAGTWDTKAPPDESREAPENTEATGP